MTAKSYLKLHPEKYIMVTYEFGSPVFVAPCKDLKIQVTDNKDDAQRWSSLDNTEMKLKFHASLLCYKHLQFELAA